MSADSLFSARSHVRLFVPGFVPTSWFPLSQILSSAEANSPQLITWIFPNWASAGCLGGCVGLQAFSHHRLCPLSSKDITATLGTTSPLWGEFTGFFSGFLLLQRRRSNLLKLIQVQPYFIKGNNTLEVGINLKSLFMSVDCPQSDIQDCGL